MPHFLPCTASRYSAGAAGPPPAEQTSATPARRSRAAAGTLENRCQIQSCIYAVVPPWLS